jgi:hypothetical protein
MSDESRYEFEERVARFRAALEPEARRLREALRRDESPGSLGLVEISTPRSGSASSGGRGWSMSLRCPPAGTPVLG